MANTPKIGLKIPSTADNIAEQINIDTPNNLGIIDTEIDGVKTQINSLDANKVDNSRVLTDVPANAEFTDTVYTHPTTAGNKHIPTGGAANQYLKYSASGTAVWAALTMEDAPSVDGKSIWVGAEGSKGTNANTIYFCYQGGD